MRGRALVGTEFCRGWAITAGQLKALVWACVERSMKRRRRRFTASGAASSRKLYFGSEDGSRHCCGSRLNSARASGSSGSMNRSLWLLVMLSCHGCGATDSGDAWPGASASASPAPMSPTVVPTAPSVAPSAAPTDGALASWAGNAEYVIRWDPTTGGPKTAAAAVQTLALQGGKHSDFEVNYYGLDSPPPMPAGASSTVLRIRTKFKGEKPSKFELTYKLRGGALFTHEACPIPTAEGWKEEMDVTFLGLGQSVKRVYSASCEVTSQQAAPVPPTTFGAGPGSCPAKMARDEFEDATGKTKVELWSFADQSTLLEVSRSTAHSDAELKAFEDTIAAPLVKLGVVPVAASKAEAAITCDRGTGK